MADERTRLKYLLQAKKDTSTITSKFAQAITTLTQSWTTLQSSSVVSMSDYDAVSLQSWLDASSILGTTISIDKVAMIQRDQSQAIRTTVEESKQSYHEKQAKLRQIQGQGQELRTNLKLLETRNTELETQKTQAQTVINTYNLEQLQTYKSEKLSIIQQINELEFAIDYDAFDENVEDLAQAYVYVSKLTQQGKELQLQISNIQTQIKSVEDRQQLEINNHQAKIIDLDQQITQKDEQIKLKQEKLDIAHKFYCVKIEADCPFVAQINE